MGRADLAGAACLELVSGVVQLRPEDAMFEAMLSGWCAQQVARGLREDTVVPRERLVRRFAEVTNEYPWNWGPSHVDEWTQSLVAERHLAPSTIRGYQMDLRLFSEFICVMAAMGGPRPARRSSVRVRTRCRYATSGIRSPTSTATRVILRRGRLPARSCSGSWTTPMTRSTGPCG